jgi:hypothetical protein
MILLSSLGSVDDRDGRHLEVELELVSDFLLLLNADKGNLDLVEKESCRYA